MSAKRQVDRNLEELSGKGKLQKLTGAEFELRVLCPVSRISFLDGLSVEQQTGAAVEVQDLVPGSDERVVLIGFSEQIGRDNLNPKNGGLSSVQTALMLVFERMTAEEDKGSDSAIRVLVSSGQAFSVLGSKIKEMESVSGAKIVVVPKDELPLCVSASDELIQITGEVDTVKKALRSIAKQIIENTSRWPGTEYFPASLAVTSSSIPGQPIHRLEAFPSQSNISLDGSRDLYYHHSIDHPIISRFREAGRAKPAQEILSFHLLCHGDRIGTLINQGGQVIKTVQQDTGCDVRILEAVPDSNDRVVVVAGLVHPDDRISAVQDAVLRVQSRISRAGLEINELGSTARLLISSNQIGCLLGKGGSVIAEMRKLSGAHIHVLPKDLMPKCASEHEEVVQIDGDFEAVQKGLVQVTTRLQHYFFVEAFPSRNNISPNPAFPDQSQLSSLPFMASTELSNHGPPFLKSDYFDTRRGVDCYPLINDIHQFGGAAHISDRRHWGPQGLLEGRDSGLLEGRDSGLREFGGGPQRRVSEFLGRDLATDIIPSTTVEVIVPHSVVPAIYGEDGECLKQICEFCDAKITIAESKPEEEETTFVIYGTPEQTHAAQSLIQAFVISETEST